VTFWPFFILTLMLGACVGSFLNVVVYRLPLGLSLVSPPSTCPKCNTRIAIYDNVPVFGWLWLRGRCRNCANPISPQYPILEGFCALMFGMLFLAYYHTGDRSDFLRIHPSQTASVFVLHLFLLGGLIGASKIDANLFIIPLQIPWTVTVVALILVPASAWGFPDARHVLPVAEPWMMGAALGGGAGLIAAFVLLKRGVMPMSFLEPEEDAEAQAVEGDGSKSKNQKKDKKDKRDKAKKKKQQGSVDRPSPMVSPRTVGVDDASANTPTIREASSSGLGNQRPLSAKAKAVYLLIITAIAVALWLIGGLNSTGNPQSLTTGQGLILFWARFAAFVLLWWGVLLIDFGAYGDAKDLEGAGPEHWFIHPRPRFESLKELLYLALPILGAIIGIAIANTPSMSAWLTASPLPLKAFAGSVFGYLAGCGIVWGVRILGTLGFGKEAMGLGDVHLVGAIGAVIGAGDAVLAFLLAAFLGLGYALVEATLGRLIVKRGVQIPYGPHLCGAAIMLMLFRTPIKIFAVEKLGLPIFGW